MAIALSAAIACAVVLLVLFTRPHYVTVMTGLDNKSLGQVQTELQTLKIPSEIQGTSVLVPRADANTARIQLSEAGLPSSGYIGYSSIKNSFGMTQDEFNIQVLDALQQSLNGTIQSINGIESAQVHIVMQQPQLFVSQPTETAKASVFVQLGSGVQLSPVQVAGIQQLVAHSVDGLSTQNVTVVDQNGVTLSSTSTPGSTLVSATSSEMAQRQSVEAELTRELTAGLDRIVGQGNAVVMVNANMSFNQVHTTSNVLQPAPGSQTGFLTNQQVTRSSSTSGSNATGGAAGQSSTNPGTPTYAGQSTGGTGSTSQSSQKNQWAYDTVKTDTVADPIQINGYNVGVMLNAADTSLTPSVINQVKAFVQSAVGAKSGPSASNNISVSKVPFSAVNTGLGTAASASKLPLYGGIGGGVLVLLAAIWFFMRRRRPAADALAERVTAEEMAALEPQESLETGIQSQVARLATQKPDEFTSLLRSWLMNES